MTTLQAPFSARIFSSASNTKELEAVITEYADRDELLDPIHLTTQAPSSVGMFSSALDASSNTKENTIDKSSLARIVNHYQTQSWFYFFFSWLGLNDKRSATIGALFVLANDPQTTKLITQQQIEQAIKSEKNQDTQVHRLSLFQRSSREQKNGTSTDNIISELRDEFNKTCSN